jgi:uncharacterized protein (DUF1800 family)
MLRLFTAAVRSISLVSLVVIAACSSEGNNNSGGSASSLSGTNPAQLVPSNIEVVGSEAAATTNMGTIATTGPRVLANAPPEQAISEKGAFRLLQQATFGATEAGIAQAKAKGPRLWLAEQFAMPTSTLGYRDRDAIHKWANKDSGFCEQFDAGTPEKDNCWRDWYSTDLIKLDFFKQASLGTDQLRQRMGFALGQILVVSEVEVNGVYGLSDYFQMLRDKSFGNYRDVLKSVALHPVMGEYLNMVNNDKGDPNENFAREMLQLFSIGTCELNPDATLKSGACIATYDNAKVREYAYALTGWTFPSGGVNAWCSNNCGWKNPTYLKGQMMAVASQHDNQARSLLSGVNLGASRSPMQAMDAAIDSLMNHPNIAPFIAKRLIQAFVSSNPSKDYVARVANAFIAGKFENFGTGAKGDLQATLAALLLDSEARDDASMGSATAGMLRDPVVMMVSSIRALNGYTDGERLGKFGWGSALSQPLFNSPSVFNFYAPDYRLPGTQDLLAPQFQLSNANTNMGWINFANDLVYWWYDKGQGLTAKQGLLGATGSNISYAAFEKDAENSNILIDRLDRLFTGGQTSAVSRAAIAKALEVYTNKDTWLADANNRSSWQRERVKTAAYLLIASPGFQVLK